VNGERRLLVVSGQPVSVTLPGLAVIDVMLAFLLMGGFGRATAFGTRTNRTGCLTVTVTVFRAVIDEGVNPPCVERSRSPDM
jgi:hypothetical protein